MLKKKLVIPNKTEKVLQRLPKEIREKFWDQTERLFVDPSHPSLRHKRVRGTRNDWEFSITMNYRAVYRIVGEDLVMVLVGKHEDVF